MVHSKQYISDIVAITNKLNIAGVVISPGSRNAPLIRAFAKCTYPVFSIIDERSAGFFALGLAMQKKCPAILICTSGSAALNYAPAVAEAFFAGVPLLVITADRPQGFVNENENQTIYQQNIYGLNCKASFHLGMEANTEKELKLALLKYSGAYKLCIEGLMGPVHVNIPLSEPLYEPLPKAIMDSAIPKGVGNISDKLTENIDLQQYKQVLIVVGQSAPDNNTGALLQGFIKKGAVVIAEPISNINGDKIIAQPFFIFDRLPKPDCVIFTGGKVISGKLNTYLRQLKGVHFININHAGHITRPFGQQCVCLKADLGAGLRHLLKKLPQGNQTFGHSWLQAWQAWLTNRNYCLNNTPFSDLGASKLISQAITSNSVLFAGNSSIIRYLQLFDLHSAQIYANRGTSGIDGCLSTAVGIANATSKMVIAVLGDIGFLYDSNALWNNYLPPNLKIIVINNGGGGIFKLINNPQDITDILPYQETKQHVKIEKVCAAYQIDYLYANNFDNFKVAISKLLHNLDGTCLLEVDTTRENNHIIFKEFIEKTK